MFRFKSLLACFVILSFVTLAVITVPADAEAWGNGKIPPGLQKKLNLDGNGYDSFWLSPGNGKHIPYGQLKKAERFREMHRYALNPGFTYLEGTVEKVLPGDPAFIVLDIYDDDIPLAVIKVADDATILVDGRVAELEDLEGYSAVVLVNPGGNAIVVLADSDGDYRDDDRDAPEVGRLEPADGEKDVEPGLKKLVVTFDENIYRVYSEKYVEEKIEVVNVTDDKEVEVSDIDINGKELVIHLTRRLEEKCKYSACIPEGLFRDSDGNKFEGIDRGDWEFVTKEEKDNDDPEIYSLEPGDGKKVYYNVKEIVARFDEKIRWANSDEGEGRVFVFNLTDKKMLEPREVVIIEDRLVLKFNDYLDKGEYGVIILSGAIEDLAGNEFGCISLSEWSFEIM